ncbi:MAG: hypothetical protein HYX64_03260 [Gammaproteobacteria bacterium]|nr:hypothetical protein [Gammaproteobacteria bacterium]
MDAFDLSAFEAPNPKCLANILLGESRPKGAAILEIGNEIKPVDLYCYLYAKFGPPNGMQNFLRRDDSDNMIHWDWTLAGERGLVQFLGMNYRTEIFLIGDISKDGVTKESIVSAIKVDIPTLSKRVGEIRKSLEKWKHFVNPYQRLKSSIDSMKRELDLAGLNPDDDAIENISSIDDMDSYTEKWKEKSDKYSKALGIAFGIRSMLPVLAEAFVNLLIFACARPEIRSDRRLMDDLYKRPIDVRIRSLHINCVGFERPIDYSSKECAEYHSLVNERNDLLHGNVAVDKLCFEEIYFNKRVPIFNEYRSMWERSLRAEIDAVGLPHVQAEIDVVDRFIDYVLSCMEKRNREGIELMMSRRDLGYNPANYRPGVLLPEALPDFRMGFSTSQEKSSDNV